MLKDKVIIVTGAGSGIGLATAVILAQAGARVVVSGLTAADLEEAVKKIRDAGGEAVAIAADVSKEADVIAMVDGALSTFGRVDRAFNNAGIVCTTNSSMVSMPTSGIACSTSTPKASFCA